MARIGVMGGTFDPIHFGHLILASEAFDVIGLDRVIFVTSANPPHKNACNLATANIRHQMVELAVVGNAQFEPSRIEMDRDGVSFTVDTLQGLSVNSGDELFLLMGSDEARAFTTWHEPLRILELAVLVVANRPGYDPEESISTIPNDMRWRIRTLHIPGVDISSTNIRERVAKGMNVRYLVPDAVRNYIIERGLYKPR